MDDNPYKSPETISAAPPDPASQSRLASCGSYITFVTSAFAIMFSSFFLFGEYGKIVAWLGTMALAVYMIFWVPWMRINKTE
jgi:hypothetical protein